MEGGGGEGRTVGNVNTARLLEKYVRMSEKREGKKWGAGAEKRTRVKEGGRGKANMWRFFEVALQ